MSKVLVVEDTEVNRIVLQRRLEGMGYEVIVATDGEDGLSKARSEHPDIILMDMVLPVMDGTEVSRSLKDDPNTKQIPIIALTAHAVTKSRKETAEMGCDEYEMKPINFDRLVEKIERLLQSS